MDHGKLHMMLLGLKPRGKDGDHGDPEEGDGEGDEPSEDSDPCAECAGRMFDALKAGKRSAFVSAVTDLVSHLKEEDEEQDDSDHDEG